MVRSTPQITITGVDQLAQSLAAHDKKIKRGIAAQFLRAAPEATSYAKKNAPWTDRSGNARAGLHAKATSIDNGDAFQLLVAHSVFYGIFLETRFSGRYAILMPTVNHIGKILLTRIENMLAKMEAG